MSISFRLMLPAHIVEEMYAEAKAALPNECCGLLGGRVEAGGIARVLRCYPLRNALASPVEYQGDGRDHNAAARAMRALGIDEVAVYHSHPTSASVPSRKDLERNRFDNDVLHEFHVILSLQGGAPVMRAWRLSAKAFTEVEWVVEGSAS